MLLAKYYQLHPSSEIKESLLRYTKFCETDCKRVIIKHSHPLIGKVGTELTIMLGYPNFIFKCMVLLKISSMLLMAIRHYVLCSGSLVMDFMP